MSSEQEFGVLTDYLLRITDYGFRIIDHGPWPVLAERPVHLRFSYPR